MSRNFLVVGDFLFFSFNYSTIFQFDHLTNPKDPKTGGKKRLI